MYYTVKEVANRTGMSEHTIRYYTNRGLLFCQRDIRNRRLFDDASLRWLNTIQCLKGCGMSIDAIKEYGNLCQQGDTADSLQARYRILLEQRELARRECEQAAQRMRYLEHKVQHYEDVLLHKIPDDTNPITPSHTAIEPD